MSQRNYRTVAGTRTDQTLVSPANGFALTNDLDHFLKLQNELEDNKTQRRALEQALAEQERKLFGLVPFKTAVLHGKQVLLHTKGQADSSQWKSAFGRLVKSIIRRVREDERRTLGTQAVIEIVEKAAVDARRAYTGRKRRYNRFRAVPVGRFKEAIRRREYDSVYAPVTNSNQKDVEKLFE